MVIWAFEVGLVGVIKIDKYVIWVVFTDISSIQSNSIYKSGYF